MVKLSILLATIAVFMLLIPYQFTVNAYSPRHCEGLDVHFYASDDEAFEALMAGEVDFIDWPLTYEQYLEACASPDLQLTSFANLGIGQLDLNNNYTIADYPGIRSPTNDVEFRRALAQATDKDYFVSELVNNFAVRIDCPLGVHERGYANETCCDPANPAYPYDLAAANARLDAAGYTDWDGDGWRNYPLDWDGVEGSIGVRDEPNVDCLQAYVRVDGSFQLAIGTLLVNTIIDDLHIQVCAHYEDSDICFPIVMNQRNYHIYTSYWTGGRYPYHLWGLFHSDNWYPDGSNYVTGMNKTNEPNYPDLDEALEELWHATETTTYTAACKKATGLLVCKYCVNIPVWAYKNYWAYSKYLVGIVNMDYDAVMNTYTFLNAYKVDNPDTPVDESQEPIRMGTSDAPKALNILDSSSYFDHAVLDSFSGSLLSVNPYNLAIDQPWIAQDWYETTWFDPQDGKNKTKVTYYIRKDVWWHAPLTGEAVQKFTAHDVEFSIWYIYPHTTLTNWWRAGYVHHTHVIDDFTIEVYFDSLSMYLRTTPTEPLLCKPKLLDLLCKEEMCEYVVADPIEPSDKTVLSCDSIVQIINATKYPGGTSLREGVDYEVFGTGAPDYCHQEIHWLRPLDPGETVVFWYWASDLNPKGYYLADLPWQQTFYSLGPYYIVDVKLGVSGYATMNCVDSHFIGAPPLGEIDWTWYWEPGPYPRSGYYQVNLYDAVALMKAYCSRGDSCPVPTNWFPGADIDPYDLSHVGLYDAVQLLTNYGKKFGSPP